MSFTQVLAEKLAKCILELSDEVGAVSITQHSEGRNVWEVNVCDLLDLLPSETMALFEAFVEGVPILEESLSRLAFGKVHGALCIRFAHVPSCLVVAVRSIGDIRNTAIGQFVTISGVITRLGAAKAAPRGGTLTCGMCGCWIEVVPKASAWCMLDGPQACPRCFGRKLVVVEDQTRMMDYQELRLQDSDVFVGGTAPRHITVVVVDDLVGATMPGDSVVVGGIVRGRWRPPKPGHRVEVELVLEANHVRRAGQIEHSSFSFGFPADLHQFWVRQGTDEFVARRRFIGEVAPHLHGLEMIKLALLLVLVGAPEHQQGAIGSYRDEACTNDRWCQYQDRAAESRLALHESGKTRLPLRSTSHILVIGDPGSGKSLLLQAAQELGLHVVRTSGVGSTRAGLTFSCSRDGVGWTLDAGALVLADGGVCCVDELGCAGPEELAVLHEALEQQTISIAKPGLVCRLRTRCSLVAAQNWAKDESSGLSATLESRFDLIFGVRRPSVCRGVDSTKLDADMADVILAMTPDGSSSADSKLSKENAFNLRDYIAWTRANSRLASIEPAAQDVINRYFEKLRKITSSDGHTTARTLEGLMRLAQAHARLMHHSNVTLVDAVSVIWLHQVSLHSLKPQEPQVLSVESMGHSLPTQLQRIGLRADFSCQGDYDAIKGAVLWQLGLRGDVKHSLRHVERDKARNVSLDLIPYDQCQSKARSVEIEPCEPIVQGQTSQQRDLNMIAPGAPQVPNVADQSGRHLKASPDTESRNFCHKSAVAHGHHACDDKSCLPPSRNCNQNRAGLCVWDEGAQTGMDILDESGCGYVRSGRLKHEPFRSPSSEAFAPRSQNNPRASYSPRLRSRSPLSPPALVSPLTLCRRWSRTCDSSVDSVSQLPNSTSPLKASSNRKRTNGDVQRSKHLTPKPLLGPWGTLGPEEGEVAEENWRTHARRTGWLT